LQEKNNFVLTKILKGKNCVLTGATGGIGKEIARNLAFNQCNLFLISKNETKLLNLKNELLSINNKIKIFYKATDLSDINDLNLTIKKIRKDFSKIQVLINCAGKFLVKPISKTNLNDFDDCYKINVLASFVLAKEFSKDMVKGKWGRIVNLGSSSSYMGFKNGIVYCSTKHAILGLSRSLNSELKEHNVRTLCVSPSSTKTNMGKISKGQDFNTFLDPKEVAQYIIFVMSFNKEMIIEESRLNRMIIK